MKLSVVALDYDGTIAQGDKVDPAVRDAIAAVRATGIMVLLVTGRILDELRRAAGDLHFVDGVVAENGAVLHFPHGGYTSLQASKVPGSFLEELTRRGISHVAGDCLVDAHANDAPRLLEVIRTLELPLVLAFNRSRVMTLPQGISKATGLHAALNMIRQSARNTLAIGDAENDYELLRPAEVGAAVEWGSASLRAVADVVVAGRGPAGVAEYLYALLRTGRLPAPVRARRRLMLGRTEDGRDFSLAVRGRNVLIAGDAKSGKSWMAGMLCEQLILHGYSICVLDPEGDYRSLETLPGVNILGGEDPPPTPRDLLRALRHPDRSVIIDLSRLAQDEKIEYIRGALPALNVMRRRTGLPHRIVVDEAHYFLHDAGAYDLIDLDLNGYTVVTCCASRLPPELLAATEVMITTCESNPLEVDALFTCGAGSHPVDIGQWRAMLGRLPHGQAVALPITEESGGELRLFTIGHRLTPQVRHREKYVDVPVTRHRAFVFAADCQGPVRYLRTLRELVAALEGATDACVGGYLRRGDFSRWIADVFGDHALAEKVRAAEERYRHAADNGAVPEVAGIIRARYDLTDESGSTATPFEPLQSMRPPM